MAGEYRPEDEMEDLMSNADTHSIYTGITQNQDMITKFNLHKKLKDLLENDLNNIEKKKVEKGETTFFFGDNRQGRCGVGSSTSLIKTP
jgi:hypothetical protein